jgi:hypothetical protein
LNGYVGLPRDEDVRLSTDVTHIRLYQKATHKDRLEIAPTYFAEAERADADAAAAHLVVVNLLIDAPIGKQNTAALLYERLKGFVNGTAERVNPLVRCTGGAANDVYSLVPLLSWTSCSGKMCDLVVESDIVAHGDLRQQRISDSSRVGNHIVGKGATVDSRNVVGKIALTDETAMIKTGVGEDMLLDVEIYIVENLPPLDADVVVAIKVEEFDRRRQKTP